MKRADVDERIRTHLSCATFSCSLSSSVVVSFNCVNNSNFKLINLPLELDCLLAQFSTCEHVQ